MSALMGGNGEVYDLSPLEFPERIRPLQKIFLYHATEAAEGSGP